MGALGGPMSEAPQEDDMAARREDRQSSAGAPLKRRTFLLAGGASALGAVLIAAGCGSGSGAEPDGGPDAGPDGDDGPDGILVGSVDDFPVDSVSLIDASDLIVGRDAAGLYAMSAICTHQGCSINVSDDRLPCPCHGSAFDFEGGVINGPAVDPLPHYALSVDADRQVRVDRRQPVSASERTPA